MKADLVCRERKKSDAKGELATYVRERKIDWSNLQQIKDQQ